MDLISTFLKNKNITPPDETVRLRFVEIVKSKLKTELLIKDVFVRNFVLYIKCSPAVKSEIFMNKRYILDDLKEVFGLKAPLDIR